MIATELILPKGFNRADLGKLLENEDHAILAANTLSIGVAKPYRKHEDFEINFFFRYHTNEELKEMAGDLPTEIGNFAQAVTENYQAAKNAEWYESAEVWNSRFDDFNDEPTDAERELLTDLFEVDKNKDNKYLAQALESPIGNLKCMFQSQNREILEQEETLNDYVSQIAKAEELKKMTTISDDDRIFVMQVGILVPRKVDEERTYINAVKERLQNGLKQHNDFLFIQLNFQWMNYRCIKEVHPTVFWFN